MSDCNVEFNEVPLTLLVSTDVTYSICGLVTPDDRILDNRDLPPGCSMRGRYEGRAGHVVVSLICVM
jgi:hypothetical protein